MANRYLTQFPMTYEKAVKSIFAKVTFGAAGAPTLSSANSKGVVSITRNGAGDYTIVFGSNAQSLDTYFKLLIAKHTFNSGASAPASPDMYIKTDSTGTFGTASIRIIFNAAGVATDPASGEICYFEFKFGDSNSG